MARLVRTTAVAVVLLVLGLAATPALGIQRPVYSNRISPFPKGKRGFCFKNSCSFPVRVGQTGASTGIPCSEGCPAGTICNGPVNLCFFSVDAIRNVGILAPKSERVCVSIDYPTVETRVYVPTGVVKLRVTFSGALYGSTGCSAAGICETALCKNCPSYVGPNGPMMQAEMTLQEVDQDYYDVTAIHGSNVPMVMKALSPTGTFYQPDHGIASYQCGEPGTPTPLRGEAASTWQFRPTSDVGGAARYAVVRNTGVPCSPSCTETCGLAYRSVEGGPTPDLIPNTCGKLLGVWTDNEMCAWSDAQPFDFCQKTLPNAELGGTYHQAFDCSGPYAESCFQRKAVPGCCGCTVWPELGLAYDTSNPCWSSSKGWMETVKPRLQFIKAACPTCYTYPYDDATSLFVCRTPEEDGLNMASYEIEWCPSGIELTVKTAGTGDDTFTPVPSTPTPPTTPKPGTPPTPSPNAPFTPNPAWTLPSTPQPSTPSNPQPPTPSNPQPPTPSNPQPPTPSNPQPPTPFTPNPAWTPVSPSTPNPASGPSGTSAPSTGSPSGPSGPGAATPVPNAPPQAAVGDKSSAQNNTTAIALGVVAVALAVLLVGGVVIGVVFRKKLFGDPNAAKANQVPASPNQPLQGRAPGSPREPMYEEDQGAASTERLN